MGKTGSSIKKDFFLNSYLQLLNRFSLKFKNSYKSQNYNIDSRKKIENQYLAVEKSFRDINSIWAKNKELTIEKVDIDHYFSKNIELSLTFVEQSQILGNANFKIKTLCYIDPIFLFYNIWI